VNGFLRIRSSWYPVDSIDQIDDLGGRVRVTLHGNTKIDLDPVEGEKVLRQLQGKSEPTAEPQAQLTLMARVAALEARVMALTASNELMKQKKAVKAHA
jgi:hypothetical protein